MVNRLIVLVFICLGLCGSASAQTGRFEVGGEFATLGVTGIEATDAGVGGRMAWHVGDAVAIEGAVDFFLTGDEEVPRGGRKVLGLFGPKIGWRGQTFGLFGKARAGISNVSEGQQVRVCLLIYPPPASCYAPQTRLAFDFGGVVEVYPSAKTSVRVDIGDLVTRLTTTSYRFARRGDYSSDLLFAAGFGWRF